MVQFKRLVAIKEGYITEECILSNWDVQTNECPHQAVPTTISQKTRGKGKGTKSRSRNRVSSELDEIKELQNKSRDIKKSGHIHRHIQMRLCLLIKPEFVNARSDTLEELIDQLIILEESFLDGH